MPPELFASQEVDKMKACEKELEEHRRALTNAQTALDMVGSSYWKRYQQMLFNLRGGKINAMVAKDTTKDERECIAAEIRLLTQLIEAEEYAKRTKEMATKRISELEEEVNRIRVRFGKTEGEQA